MKAKDATLSQIIAHPKEVVADCTARLAVACVPTLQGQLLFKRASHATVPDNQLHVSNTLSERKLPQPHTWHASRYSGYLVHELISVSACFNEYF